MEKRVLRLVKNRSVFYIPSLQDYEVLKDIGIPLLKLEEHELPLLKSRCKRRSVSVKIKNFDVFEKRLFKKIKERWAFPLIITGSTIYIDIPKKKSIYFRAQSLVDAITRFYARHLYDVDVKVRKFSKKVRFIIERSFNGQRQPEWQEGSA